MQTEHEPEDLQPTDDSIPDGTQLPDDSVELPDEEGDAGVPDPAFDDLDD